MHFFATAAQYGRFLPRLGPFARSNGLFLTPTPKSRVGAQGRIAALPPRYGSSAVFALSFQKSPIDILQCDIAKPGLACCSPPWAFPP
jgi:hypothetical protein